MGEQLHAAFHSLPKADAAFSNSSALFFSFPVFIYLLLVLKTKTVSLFNALEMGGGWEVDGKEDPYQARITWPLRGTCGGMCAHVRCVES